MKHTLTLILLTLFCLSSLTQAAELDGRTVLLLVTKDKATNTDVIKQKLLETRKQIGYSKKDLPIVFLTFDGSETERTYTERLGINAEDSPVLCVVEWANDATHGPKRILDNAVVRQASTQEVDSMLISYLKAVHHTGEDKALTVGQAAEVDDLTPGLLEIESHRFEASGKPFYLADAGIRIKNADNRNLHNIAVRFYSKLNEDDRWQLMDEQVVEKLPKGYVASRDFVGNTKQLGLTDEKGNAVPCFYRIEVEQGGQVVSREGKFEPSESPIDIQ
jgi:hypothetical protein